MVEFVKIKYNLNIENFREKFQNIETITESQLRLINFDIAFIPNKFPSKKIQLKKSPFSSIKNSYQILSNLSLFDLFILKKNPNPK